MLVAPFIKTGSNEMVWEFKVDTLPLMLMSRCHDHVLCGWRLHQFSWWKKIVAVNGMPKIYYEIKIVWYKMPLNSRPQQSYESMAIVDALSLWLLRFGT